MMFTLKFDKPELLLRNYWEPPQKTSRYKKYNIFGVFFQLKGPLKPPYLQALSYPDIKGFFGGRGVLLRGNFA